VRVALTAAVVTRVAVFALAVQHSSRFWTKDSFEYDALARHFDRPLALSLLRPPGYPAFLRVVYSVTGRSATHAIVVELVISVATVIGTYVLARRLLGRPAAAVAAFALAIDPVSIAMSSNLTTETLFAGLWVLGALLWVASLETRAWLAALAGLVFGLSALVRPIAEYLPVLLVPLTLALARAHRVGAAALLLVAFAIPTGLWIARNHHDTGVATLSTVGAHNLLDYRAAGALALDTHRSRVDVARRLDAEIHRSGNPARDAQAESSLAWHTLEHHPKGASVMTVEGLGRVLFGPGRAELARLVVGSTTGPLLLVAVEAGILFTMLLVAAVGVVLLARAGRWIPLAATLTFVAYDVVLSAGPEGDARLRMPAAPFLAVLVGAGAVRVVNSRARTSAA